MKNPFRNFFESIKRCCFKNPNQPVEPENSNGRIWVNVNCKTSVISIISQLTTKLNQSLARLNPKGFRKQGGTVGCEFNILTGKFKGDPVTIHTIADFVHVFNSGQKQAVMLNIFGIYQAVQDFTLFDLKNYLESLISAGATFDFLELGNEAYLPGQTGEIDAIYPPTLEVDGVSIGARIYAEHCIEVINYLRGFTVFNQMKFGVISCFPVAGKPKTLGWNKKVSDIVIAGVPLSTKLVYTIHKYTGSGSPNVVDRYKWGQQAIKAARSVNAEALEIPGKIWVTESSYINDPGSGDNIYLNNYAEHQAFDILFLIHLHKNPDVEEVFKHSVDGRYDFELINPAGDLTYSGLAMELVNKMRGNITIVNDYKFVCQNGFIEINPNTLQITTDIV